MERQIAVPESQLRSLAREATSLLGGGTDWDSRVCTFLEKVAALDEEPAAADPPKRIARQLESKGDRP